MRRKRRRLVSSRFDAEGDADAIPCVDGRYGERQINQFFFGKLRSRLLLN
jgi:hypothetical protein